MSGHGLSKGERYSDSVASTEVVHTTMRILTSQLSSTNRTSSDCRSRSINHDIVVVLDSKRSQCVAGDICQGRFVSNIKLQIILSNVLPRRNGEDNARRGVTRSKCIIHDTAYL